MSFDGVSVMALFKGESGLKATCGVRSEITARIEPGISGASHEVKPESSKGKVSVTMSAFKILFEKVIIDPSSNLDPLRCS